MVGKYNHISHTWRNMGPYSYIHCKLHSSGSFIWWKKSHISYLWSLHLPPSKENNGAWLSGFSGVSPPTVRKEGGGHLKPWEALVSPKGYKNPLRSILNPGFWRWGRITHRVTYSREVFVMKFWWGILITNVIFCARVQNGQRKSSWMVWHGSWEEIPKS